MQEKAFMGSSWLKKILFSGESEFCVKYSDQSFSITRMKQEVYDREFMKRSMKFAANVKWMRLANVNLREYRWLEDYVLLTTGLTLGYIYEAFYGNIIGRSVWWHFHFQTWFNTFSQASAHPEHNLANTKSMHLPRWLICCI